MEELFLNGTSKNTHTPYQSNYKAYLIIVSEVTAFSKGKAEYFLHKLYTSKRIKSSKDSFQTLLFSQEN